MMRAGLEVFRARAMYLALARGLVDLLAFLFLPGSRARLVDRVTIDSATQATLDRALARGPVLFFASHTGNWELAAAAASRMLAQRGRRLCVVAKPMHVRLVERLARRLRGAIDVDVISPDGALRNAGAALRAGSVVVLPIDQRPSRGILVPFLGENALVDRAPAVLAARAGATILVTAMGLDHRIHILEVVAPGRGRDFVDQAMTKSTQALEKFIRKEPEGWLWLHRRWSCYSHGHG